MFRGLLFAFGIGIAILVVAYFITGRARYLAWARRMFLAGLAVGVLFFAVLLLKRLI
jgi:ABC-type Fe3+-siderophore transport system permease subunit